MKRLSAWLFIVLFVSGCAKILPKIERLKPWNIVEQNPADTGFIFVKMEPTIAYSPTTSMMCKSGWVLVQLELTEPSKASNLGVIETPTLIDGKYLLYPVKPAERLYSLVYFAYTVVNASSKQTMPYKYNFTVKPGEIAYLGSIKRNDSCKYYQTWNQITYTFESIEILDDYDQDIRWLRNRFNAIFTEFSPTNYHSTLRFK